MSQTQDRDILYKANLSGTALNVGPYPVPAPAQDPNIALNVSGSSSSYFGLNVFNFGTAGTTSVDMVVANNAAGTGASGTYTDFGMTGNNLSDSNYAVFDSNAGYAYSQSNNMYLGAGTSGTVHLFAGGFDSKSKVAVVIDPLQNVAMGTGAVGSAGTAGFLYIRGGAGAPTGTPVPKTGLLPMYYDTTNNNLYFYAGASWKKNAGGTYA